MRPKGIRYVIARTKHVEGGKGIPATMPPFMVCPRKYPLGD